MKMSLRTFCKEHHLNTSLVSRIERGRINPCKYNESKDLFFDRYLEYLDIKEGMKESLEFWSLLYRCKGEKIEPLSDEEVAKRLPIFIHNDGSKCTEEELEDVINIIKNE